jgi:hypothetical protein
MTTRTPTTTPVITHFAWRNPVHLCGNGLDPAKAAPRPECLTRCGATEGRGTGDEAKVTCPKCART